MTAIASSATGNWNATGTWTPAQVPIAGDTVTISAGDTVTLTATHAAASVTIAATGVLDIAGQSLTLTASWANGGLIKMGPGGYLSQGAGNSTGDAGSTEFIGAEGNRCTWTGSGLYFLRGGYVTAGAYQHFNHIDISVDTRPYGWGYESYIKNFTWGNAGNNKMWCQTTSEVLILEDGLIDGGNYVFRDASTVFMRNVKQGSVGGGPSNLNFGSGGYRYEFDNCEINANMLAGPLTRFRSMNHQQVPGDWLLKMKGGTTERATAAKKAGAYGVELTPSSTCDPESPMFFDIDYPIDSGDSVSPAFYYKNVGADLNLEAGADLFVAELDPGNAWGLYELVDVNTEADSYLNWRQVSFAGGIAGGTGASGMLKIRIWLKKYAAGASVYVADVAF